jgi:hypothetical protein
MTPVVSIGVAPQIVAVSAGFRKRRACDWRARTRPARMAERLIAP